MTSIERGALGLLAALGVTILGGMVSEEVRDRLDHLPHAILRLAASRLRPDLREAVYDDEWLPELTHILKGDEARPVTRLIHGTWHAMGILVAASRSANLLTGTRRQAAVRRRVRTRIAELKSPLVATMAAVLLGMLVAGWWGPGAPTRSSYFAASTAFYFYY